jgi:hypothetical protein
VPGRTCKQRAWKARATACLLLLLLQVLGAIAGAGLVVALTPANVYAGMGDGGPGCFDGKAASSEITKAQVFGWEVSVRSINCWCKRVLNQIWTQLQVQTLAVVFDGR